LICSAKHLCWDRRRRGRRRRKRRRRKRARLASCRCLFNHLCLLKYLERIIPAERSPLQERWRRRRRALYGARVASSRCLASTGIKECTRPLKYSFEAVPD